MAEEKVASSGWGGADRVRPGQVLLDRYEILERVGEGGSGAVFRAKDLVLSELVALKILYAPVGEELLERFRREVRVTRRINHPNVVRVFDLVQHAELHILSMQWIDGRTLTDRVRAGGPLPVRQALRLVRVLASALGAAHRIGVVHRDVKPDNVLLGPQDEPFLLDFGVATEQGAERLTEMGSSPGTPGFMAPEQELGDEVGPAADVFALGMTCCFALGVRWPEEAARLPRPLRKVMEGCLTRNPAERCPSMEAVQAELARLDRARVARRALLIGGGLSVAGLGALAAGRKRAVLRLALEPLENRAGPGEAWLELGAVEVLAGLLSECRPLEVYAPAKGVRGMATVRGAFDGPPVRLRLEVIGLDGVRLGEHQGSAGQPVTQQLESAAAEIASLLGAAAPPPRRLPHPEALRSFSEALRELWKHRSPEALASARAAALVDPSYARAQLLVAVLSASYSLGPRSEARSALAAVRARRESLPGRDLALVDGAGALCDAYLEDRPADSSPMWGYLARYPGDRLAYFLGSRLLRGPERERTLKAWMGAFPPDSEPHNQLGYLHQADGDLAAAERHFREASRLAPSDANPLDSLADNLTRQGRLPEALGAAEAALSISPSFAPAAARAAEIALADDRLDVSGRWLQVAEGLVNPDSDAFGRVLRVGSGLELLRRGAAAATGWLERVAAAPSTGARSFVAHELAAVIHALAGDLSSAERALETSALAARMYEEGASRSALYVRALAALNDASALEEVAAAIETERAAGREVRPSPTAAIVAAGLELLRGRPLEAAARLEAEPGSASRSARLGSSFLVAFLRARALRSAGRRSEARIAWLEAVRRRRTLDQHPEPVFFWRSCLSEAAQALEEAKDSGGAEALRASLRKLEEQAGPR
ncbi:MAG: protein kinase [Myxococcales bacterium]|nr:protein kinase [Myxococcales bacterium]